MSIKLIIFVNALFIFSCTATKKVQQPLSESNQQSVVNDSSNYYLFNYIDALKADDYELKLDSIKKGESRDFFTLRMAYAKTTDYYPYESTEDREKKNKIVTLLDSNKFDLALLLTQSILKRKFVDIKSHLYAGYIYKQLKKETESNYHYDIYEGLLNSIYNSGEGRNFKTAYFVISTVEEYDFLNWFNMYSEGQSLYQEDGYAFDVLKAYDKKNDERHNVYFNIKLVMDANRKIFGGK